MSIRERDVRAAIRDTLMATGAFDAVSLVGFTETREGISSSDMAAAAVEPMRSRNSDYATRGAVDVFDASPGTVTLEAVDLAITFVARDEDIQLCDEKAERLLNVARAALNGKQLIAGTPFNVLDRTRFTAVKWLPRQPPERRIEATFSYEYVVDGWDDYDTSD